MEGSLPEQLDEFRVAESLGIVSWEPERAYNYEFQHEEDLQLNDVLRCLEFPRLLCATADIDLPLNEAEDGFDIDEETGRLRDETNVRLAPDPEEIQITKKALEAEYN